MCLDSCSSECSCNRTKLLPVLEEALLAMSRTFRPGIGNLRRVVSEINSLEIPQRDSRGLGPKTVSLVVAEATTLGRYKDRL